MSDDTTQGTVPGPTARRRLQELLQDEGPSLVVGKVIGKGGNGVVCVATQRRVGREVAVKLPRRDDLDAVGSVVQEAWVAGVLEHPHIVPVYDIRVIDGRPAVVMKRIDGVPWRKLLGDPTVVTERFGAPDALEWHLRTLLSVCHAIEYAHSKGVLHGDLKPDNVMIGRFGEVWVVDWGTAVSLTDDASSRIPRAMDQSSPAGTPAYMAPEQAMGKGRALSERTDVFLLGALLFEVVTGQPPRKGPVRRAMQAAVAEAVVVEASWPLAPLLGAALALDPGERPVSVAAFRREVERFLERRGAERLLSGARQVLADLQADIAAGEVDRVAIYDRYGAARFGFQQALDAWPGQRRAREGLRTTHELMVDYELQQGDARAARLHLARLDAAPPELEERVAALEAAQARDADVLAQLKEDGDPRTAWWARLAVMGALGTVWVLTPVTSAVLGVPQGFARELAISGSTFVLALLVMGVMWRSLLASRLNRVLVVSVAAGPGLAFLLNVGGWLAGIDSELSGTLELFAYFEVAVFATLLGEWRLFVGALGFLAAFFLSMWWEGTTLLWMNLANLLVVANAAVVWVPMAWRREQPEDRPWLRR